MEVSAVLSTPPLIAIRIGQLNGVFCVCDVSPFGGFVPSPVSVPELFFLAGTVQKRECRKKRPLPSSQSITNKTDMLPAGWTSSVLPPPQQAAATAGQPSSAAAFSPSAADDSSNTPDQCMSEDMSRESLTGSQKQPVSSKEDWPLLGRAADQADSSDKKGRSSHGGAYSHLLPAIIYGEACRLVAAARPASNSYSDSSRAACCDAAN